MKRLSENRDLKDYVTVIDTLFISYVKTEEFANTSEQERFDIVESCKELKDRLIETQGEYRNGYKLPKKLE